jgi:hypothetical protein
MKDPSLSQSLLLFGCFFGTLSPSRPDALNPVLANLDAACAIAITAILRG